MWKIALVVVLLGVGLWFAIDALITTDTEEVEAEVARLLDLGREGGEEAGKEILAALADDYRGAGFYSRESLESYVRRFVVEEHAEEIKTGDYKAVEADAEIVVPILTISARSKRGEEPTAFLRVTFAKRGDRFRIVNVESMRLER